MGQYARGFHKLSSHGTMIYSPLHFSMLTQTVKSWRVQISLDHAFDMHLAAEKTSHFGSAGFPSLGNALKQGCPHFSGLLIIFK